MRVFGFTSMRGRLIFLMAIVGMVAFFQINMTDSWYQFGNDHIHFNQIRPSVEGLNASTQPIDKLQWKWDASYVGFKELMASNCTLAFSGNAKNSQFNQNVSRVNVSMILEDSKNCKDFRRVYGMERYPPPSKEEEEFPIAFSIVFHTDLDQVMYLLRAIYRRQNVYCLHVDAKADASMIAAVRAIADCFPNVVVASKLERIVYAGYSRLQAELTCMNDMLIHPIKWRYFINAVGQQFPLKSNLEMVQILKMYNGSNDIEGILGNRRLLDRYELKHYIKRNTANGNLYMTNYGEKNPPPPHNLEIVKGSVFGSFSRAFVEFLLKDKVAADLLQWSKNVYSPDEYVFSTLHHSKIIKVPGGYVAGEADRKPWLSVYANWAENPCSGFFVRSICIFATGDLHALSQRHEFFANKFYISFNPAALHCLDQRIYNLTLSKTVRDLDYYRTLPFVISNSNNNRNNSNSSNNS